MKSERTHVLLDLDGTLSDSEPGILRSLQWAFEKEGFPIPTEEQVRYWLAGNLCRCTGYDKIIRAVMDAAAEMRGAA